MNTDAITIKYGTSGVISADDFEGDGFALQEGLCSESQIVFGACESAAVEVNIISSAASFVGQTLQVYLGTTLLGQYKVVSDERASDGESRTLTAYDALYDVNGKDVSNWYNSLNWDNVKTLKQFRDSFFAYLGISQASATLVNDSMVVSETLDATSLSGATVLQAICEINGVFGHINANGNFEYIELSSGTATTVAEDEVYDTSQEDFTVPAFDSVLIRTEEGDIGGQYPSSGGSNQYIITSNFLCYGKDSSSLQTIAQNVSSKIFNRSYTPFECELDCQGSISLGSKVSIPAEPATIESFVLERKLIGIEALEEYFSAQGTSEYVEDVNSPRNQTIATAQRMNKLTTTLEGTISRVGVIEGDYVKTSVIEQTEKEISAKVSIEDGDSTTSCAWSLKPEAFRIFSKGAEVLKVNDDGLSVNGIGTFSGAITSSDAVITGGSILTTAPDDSVETAESLTSAQLDRTQISKGYIQGHEYYPEQASVWPFIHYHLSPRFGLKFFESDPAKLYKDGKLVYLSDEGTEKAIYNYNFAHVPTYVQADENVKTPLLSNGEGLTIYSENKDLNILTYSGDVDISSSNDINIVANGNVNLSGTIKEDGTALSSKYASVNALNSEITTRTNEEAALSARMDTFTKLAEGSTTGDAELADIRTGYDGTEYSTAGSAVRGQITDLHTIYDMIWDDIRAITRLVNKISTEGFTSETNLVASTNTVV